MAYEPQKARLPATELGAERCFQISYYGHGDIVAAAWDGDLEIEPLPENGVSARFNLSHGGDPVLLASHIGYLRRLGHTEQEIAGIFLSAGQAVLSDDLGPGFSGQQRLSQEVEGSGFPRFDVPEQGLRCLMIPRPRVPGVLEHVGGTGLYTQTRDLGDDLLVWAQYLPRWMVDDGSPRIGETAAFCAEDVPTVARMICEISLGDYRRDIKKLLQEQFPGE